MTTATADPSLALIDIDLIYPHPMNANMMSAELRAKLAENIRSSGRYPPLIVRPMENGRFQLLDGEQRLGVLRELGETAVWCLPWACSDREALLLLATLNRLEGDDVPGRRAALIAALSAHDSLAELARLLPETEAQLASVLTLVPGDLDALLRELEEQTEKAMAQLPVLFSFAVPPEDAPRVQDALDRIVSSLDGPNRNGRALVILTDRYSDVGS